MRAESPRAKRRVCVRFDEQEPLSVFKRSQMDQDYPLDGLQGLSVEGCLPPVGFANAMVLASEQMFPKLNSRSIHERNA